VGLRRRGRRGWGGGVVGVVVCASRIASSLEVADYKEELTLPQDPRLRAAVLDLQNAHFADQMQQFVDKSLRLEAEKDAGKVAREIFRVANDYFSNAFDKALLALGVSTTRFIPPHRAAPLGSDEHRYYVDAMGADGKMRRRSCVVNMETSARRFEIIDVFIDGKRHEPLLIRSLDRGSIGQPHSQMAAAWHQDP
jgi:hypothetical protein